MAGRRCSPSFISRHSTEPLVSNGTRELRFQKQKCLGFEVPSKKQRKQKQSTMEAFGGFVVDEKAVTVENAFLDFLKRFPSSSLSSSNSFFSFRIENY